MELVQAIPKGEDADEPEEENLSKKGFAFIGWDSEKYLGVSEDVTITAQWKKDDGGGDDDDDDDDDDGGGKKKRRGGCDAGFGLGFLIIPLLWRVSRRPAKK